MPYQHLQIMTYFMLNGTSFFEEREEYEKCAHIKKIQDTIKKILDKA
jgi:hypothetical protein